MFEGTPGIVLWQAPLPSYLNVYTPMYQAIQLGNLCCLFFSRFLIILKHISKTEIKHIGADLLLKCLAQNLWRIEQYF